MATPSLPDSRSQPTSSGLSPTPTTALRIHHRGQLLQCHDPPPLLHEGWKQGTSFLLSWWESKGKGVLRTPLCRAGLTRTVHAPKSAYSNPVRQADWWDSHGDLKILISGDFPAGDSGLLPGWGTKSPHASERLLKPVVCT